MSEDAAFVRKRAPSLPRGERRDQLLGCAIRVFARQGIGSARHAAIAAEAGVAVPTVFSYFPTRAELVREVLLEVDRFLIEMIQDVVARKEGAADTLLAVVREFAHRAESHPDHIKVWLDWSTAVRDEIWPLYEDFQTRVIRSFVEVIRKGQASGELMRTVDPEAAAYLVVGSGNMIAQMMFTRRDPARVQRFLETVIYGALRHREGVAQ